MKAMPFYEVGGPEVLQWVEMETPAPGIGEVLLKVSKVGVNRLDLMVRSGKAGRVALPHISGSEVVGEVAQLGTGTKVALGQRMAVAPYLFCGHCEYCLRGDETRCVTSDILGLQSQGGYAEYVTVPEESLVPIPDAVDDASAAAVSLSTLTAWHMLVDRAEVGPGDTVLVWAAGSGVGSAAIQIARLMGARVIATAGSDEKVARAQEEFGAEFGINYRKADVAQEVRRWTGKRGVDVVFEHLGADTMATSLRVLARGGRVVTCGTLTGTTAEVDLWTLFAKELSLLGAYGGTRHNLRQVLDSVAAGKIKPVIDGQYPLRDAAEAQRRMEDRQNYGKILLDPTN